jgi:hypothetical protein
MYIKFSCTVLVIILLRNGLTDFDEILYVYSVGLRIGCYLFFIPLSDKGGPPQFFFYFLDKIIYFYFFMVGH